MSRLLNKPKRDLNLTGSGSGTKLSFCFGDAESRRVSGSKLWCSERQNYIAWKSWVSPLAQGQVLDSFNQFFFLTNC
jgi:hypothetical protein